MWGWWVMKCEGCNIVQPDIVMAIIGKKDVYQRKSKRLTQAQREITDS